LLPTSAGTVAYNTFLNRYISIFVSGRWGFEVSFSEGSNVLSWKKYPNKIYPAVSYYQDSRVDNWWAETRNNTKQVYAYPSIIGLDGNSTQVGKEFYLYYMKIFDK